MRWRFLCREVVSLHGDAFCIATSSHNHFGGLIVLRTTPIHPGNQSRRDCFKTQNEQSHGDLSRSGGDSFAERLCHCAVMPFALPQALTTILGVSLRLEQLQSTLATNLAEIASKPKMSNPTEI